MEQVTTKIELSNDKEESTDSYGCKVSIPQSWVERIGVTHGREEVTLSFDGDRITIERPEFSPIKHVPLAGMNKIHRFAILWAKIYENHNSFPGAFFEDIVFVGEGLADLGFVMDGGEALKDAFPNVDLFRDLENLKACIDQIDNLQALGNSIFSQWRYWNRSDYEVMEEADYQWFVVAFTRLAELASTDG